MDPAVKPQDDGVCNFFFKQLYFLKFAAKNRQKTGGREFKNGA
jgi:hypothetical protein